MAEFRLHFTCLGVLLLTRRVVDPALPVDLPKVQNGSPKSNTKAKTASSLTPSSTHARYIVTAVCRRGLKGPQAILRRRDLAAPHTLGDETEHRNRRQEQHEVVELGILSSGNHSRMGNTHGCPRIGALFGVGSGFDEEAAEVGEFRLETVNI